MRTFWDCLKELSIEHALEVSERAQIENQDRTPLPSQGPFKPGYQRGVPDIRTNEASVHFDEGHLQIEPSGAHLHVLVARTSAARAMGLQNRDDVGIANGTYDGLLMDWGQDTQASLHGKNVSFPFSAAFFDSEGMYRDHAHFIPGEYPGKKASAVHQTALEVHRDDWDSLGIGPGSRVSLMEEKDATKANPPIQMGR